MFDIATRALRLLPAEAAHRVTLALAGLSEPILMPLPPDDPRLAVKALGLNFPNPIGLAAGFDKNAQVPDAMARFGFGFVECGTVTPKPQAGNPKPRLFRLTEDGAVINRMGFNNDGMSAVENNLRRRKGKGLVGINIGANKDSADRVADYVLCFEWLAPQADYVTVNVSSPNTPGLRGLQNKDELTRLLGALTEARGGLPLARASALEGERPVAGPRASEGRGGDKKIPLLLKIAPDLDQAALEEIAEVALASGIEGLIVSNTTLARPLLQSLHADEQGGLSGRPLLAPSTKILAQMRRLVGNRLVLVGVGGIAGSADAYAKIRAGASLVQLYTGLVYEGPGLVERIKQGLARRLAHDGFSSVAEAVGMDVNEPVAKS